MAVRRLARAVLPERAGAAEVARVLLEPLPHGRGEQLLLPPPGARDVRTVAGPDAVGVHRLGQGESVHHPHEAIAGSRRSRSHCSGSERPGSATGSVPCCSSSRRVSRWRSSDCAISSQCSRRGCVPPSSSETPPGTRTTSSSSWTTLAPRSSGPTGPGCGTTCPRSADGSTFASIRGRRRERTIAARSSGVGRRGSRRRMPGRRSSTSTTTRPAPRSATPAR